MMDQMTPDEAVKIIAFDLDRATVGSGERVLEAIHAIVADVIDSCALAVTSYTGRDGRGQADLDLVAEEVVMTVNDYVANTYGVEEFGL